MYQKRIFLCLLSLLLLLMPLAPVAAAAELTRNIASGTCGDEITWSLDGYTMTVSGSGDMDDGCPWEDYKDHIETVILTGDITKVGAKAFQDCQFIRDVDFGDSLREIGERAFSGCERIQLIHLPATFRVFGASCFRGCENLEYVYCDGGMPSFKDSCLYTGNYISVFYPTNNPWPQEYVSQLISNFGGRLGIMMGNYQDSDVVLKAVDVEDDDNDEDDTTSRSRSEDTEETASEPETQPATEPAIVLVTEPATEPVQTQPVTQPTEPSVPATEAATSATEETTSPVTLPTETQPQEPERKVDNKAWIGLVMIVGVLTFLIAGVMIVRSTTRRGGRY